MLEVFLRSLYCERTREIGFKLIFGLMHQLLLWSGCMKAAFNSGSLIEHFLCFVAYFYLENVAEYVYLKRIFAFIHTFVLYKNNFLTKNGPTESNCYKQTLNMRYYRLKIIWILASNLVYQLLEML